MNAAERIADLEAQLRAAKAERQLRAHAPMSEPGGLLYWQIGINIREARIAAGLTQAELAERVPILRTSITNIEAGRQRLPLTTLYDIADALKVQAVQLLPRNEDV